MTAATHSLTFTGHILQRGFWLYVWEVTLADGSTLHYVGRTGDNSSPNAQSPFVRMGQHLGFAKTSSMLRTHLTAHNVLPDSGTYRLVAHGPILEEADDFAGHRARRDVMAGLEKALAEAMAAAGYEVMNTVKSRQPVDEAMFEGVRDAFGVEFPRLLGTGRGCNLTG